KLENSLLTLKIFGGVVETKIPLEIPTDEVRLAELELVFNREHEDIDSIDLEKEAKEILARYEQEIAKQRIKELNEHLSELDEESEEYEETIIEISCLQKKIK
ncbi:hypothetical protein J6S37_00570, partial [Candidatus Saccharibacteria bacterium]|nr:hypothetical protein [Candidatus Saccharibacteria bacterium]